MSSRASLKGKGVEILFGEERPFELLPEEGALMEEADAAEMKEEMPAGEVAATTTPLEEALAPEKEAGPPEEKPPEEAPAAEEKPPEEVPTITAAEEARPEEKPPVSKEVALARVGEERIREVAAEIEQLYEEVAKELSSRAELVEEALKYLQEARNICIEDPTNFDEAEYKVGQVKVMLIRVRNSRVWGAKYGTRLLIYEVGLFLLFLGAIAFEKPLALWISTLAGLSSAATSMSQLFPLWDTLLWGGIGGVVGALYSLHWHVSEKQDFDKQHIMWYVVQPIMGIILGGIIYLITAAGFLALGMGEQLTALGADKLRWLPSLVACLAGFRQKFAYELLDQIIQAVGRRPS